MMNSILSAAAAAAHKAAVLAAGAASYDGLYQPKEPAALRELSK